MAHDRVLSAFLDATFLYFSLIWLKNGPTAVRLLASFLEILFDPTHQGCLGRFIGSLWLPFGSILNCFGYLLDSKMDTKLATWHQTCTNNVVTDLPKCVPESVLIWGCILVSPLLIERSARVARAEF